MEPPRTSQRLWSRTLWIALTVLTLIGMLGVAVDFLAFFAIHGPLTGGSAAVGVADLLVFGLIALPLAWAGLTGVSTDVGAAMTPAPHLVAARAGCGVPPAPSAIRP